tara:strand:+ start:245 stop:466 length:222 start_codon:yes stop_codon:yes gene_type:complete
MLGKLIILMIAFLATLGLLHKLASRLGLIKTRPAVPKLSRHIGASGFRLTKFNIAMLSLVGLYLIWGITQVMR